MKRKWIAACALSLILLFAFGACGSGSNMAATMHLVRTEGTVQVDDAEGEQIEIVENLGLYSGYGVATQEESYGWMNLDDTKLAKLDEESAALVKKDGSLLELEVQAGSLFFHVTEPLSEEEAMNIRSSDMIVGIRGTCGWVEVSEDGTVMRVYLLEGKVTCTAGDKTAQVKAGEMAVLTAAGEIEVGPFSLEDIPAFVREEIKGDEGLAGQIAEWNEELAGQLAEEGEPGRQPQEDQEGTEQKEGGDGSGSGEIQQPARITQYRVDNEGETPVFLYEYGNEEPQGQKVDIYRWENGEWVFHFTVYRVTTYNEQGRLQSSQSYDPDGEMRTEISMIENGEDYSVYRQTSDNTADQTYTTSYNQQGQMLKDEYAGSSSYTNYEYDELGRVGRKDFYRSDGSLYAYHIYEYGE